ncbi:MAG TPA: nuclear transport factor 2 family protein [Leptospiraceae bacterium]|nr:nuclear transport factor 2 family protein [Leptospiraceae bacterium]HNF27223.1 nuclear transport factor 2 family protein [Leptospiraceae bacterium]HNO22324.1 nuclear transport factor 2 family protein [Leptospiraceae bacterium]
MSLTENKEIIKKFFICMNEQNYKEGFDLLSDELNWWILGNIPVSGNYDKRKISLGLKMLGRNFEAFRFTLHTMTAEEDRVSLIAESNGKRKSNGKNYNNHYHFLFTVREGKITDVKEFFDTVHAVWVEET